eukprot:2621601-Rhodomonas_salina.1
MGAACPTEVATLSASRVHKPTQCPAPNRAGHVAVLPPIVYTVSLTHVRAGSAQLRPPAVKATSPGMQSACRTVKE